MVNEFKSVYLKLPENYKNIITGTILRMDKEHNSPPTHKIFNIKTLIKFYLSKNEMTENDLLDECYKLDKDFSEETYKSILKRNLVNVQDNKTIKLVTKILNIPSDKQGNLYIEYDIPQEFKIGNIDKQKVYPFTSDYYSYISEFQSNSVYDNFSCLPYKNQQAILYLTKALYYNQTSPELFMPSLYVDESL